MNTLLKDLALCIERGKVNRNASHPKDLMGKDGADELTLAALQASVSATEILEKALMPAMRQIGEKFSEGKAFIPDLLISAKAMRASMNHLKPYFDKGQVQPKGVFIIGTVEGDMHDIGKNLVKMVLEGAGWQVIDLGVNVKSRQFLETIEEFSCNYIGLSALLTTTMLNMQTIVEQIKERYPAAHIFVGGAPLSQKYAEEIGADAYFKDPRSLLVHLEQKA